MLTSLRSTPSAIILTSIRRRLCAHPPCDSVNLNPRLSIVDLLPVLPLWCKPSDFYRSQDAILPSMLTRCSGRTLLNRMAARPGAMLVRRAANTFEGYMGCESGLARGACRELLRHSICSYEDPPFVVTVISVGIFSAAKALTLARLVLLAQSIPLLDFHVIINQVWLGRLGQSVSTRRCVCSFLTYT